MLSVWRLRLQTQADRTDQVRAEIERLQKEVAELEETKARLSAEQGCVPCWRLA